MGIDCRKHEIRCIAIIVDGDDDGFDAMKPWDCVLWWKWKEISRKMSDVLHAVHSML